MAFSLVLDIPFFAPPAFYLQFWKKGPLLKPQNNRCYLPLHLGGRRRQAMFNTLFVPLVVLLPLMHLRLRLVLG